MPDPPLLDPIFHQTVRTRLGSLLNAGACSFAELKTRLGVTDGNLDAHLRKLSAAGYLHSRMVIKDRVQTNYALSPSGKRAFAAYVSDLRAVIDPPRTHHQLADAETREPTRAIRAAPRRSDRRI